MNNNIIITLKKEIRGIIRDKRSFKIMLLMPFIIPLFIILFSYSYDDLINNSEQESKALIGINYLTNEEEENISKDYNFDTIYYSSLKEMKEAYNSGKIDCFVTNDNHHYIIYSNDYSEESSYAASIYSQFLNTYNEYLSIDYLSNNNIDIDKVYNNISYSFEELNGSNDLVNEIITLGFIMTIMVITLTAVSSATDSIAGEKERGTLETILTFPIKTREIIIGKVLAVILSCTISSIICLTLAIVSFKISSSIFDIYNNTIMNFGLINILISLLIMFSYSIFISCLCVAISSFCKSYKEAQSSLSPVTLITMIPMIFDILGIKLTRIISLIPIVNHSMILKKVFCEKLVYNDYICILIMFVSTIIYIILIIRFISKFYKSDKVLF